MDQLHQPKKYVSGNVYFTEDLSRFITAKSIEITNSSLVEDLVLKAAYPCIGNDPATKDNVTNADGFLIEDQCIAPNTTIKVGAFKFGLGISVIIGLLPEEDINEESFGADYQDRMEELNFVLKDSGGY